MKEIYSDFDMEFNLNRKTGDINKKRDIESIKQSLWCLLQTNFYDRKWHPEIGSYFPKMLFKQAHPGFFYVLANQIKELIRMNEPRVSVSDVSVYHKDQIDEDRGIVTVEISYSTIELGSHVAVFKLERTR